MAIENPSRAAGALIQHFLATLMRIERERVDLSRKKASTMAGWSPRRWGELERGVGKIDPPSWLEATEVLELAIEDVVRRLNAYIGKHPNAWIERTKRGGLLVSERAITSPRALRSGNMYNVDLNQLRPVLYYELSLFAPEPGELIELASALGFFASRQLGVQRREGDTAADDLDRPDQLRMRIMRVVNELPTEKLALLERVVDKFKRYRPKELALAYKHFSLSISKQ